MSDNDVKAKFIFKCLKGNVTGLDEALNTTIDEDEMISYIAHALDLIETVTIED